jgi:predicted nucleic acid-binding protein
LRYLLDVNVWIALLDEAHVHHSHALAFMTSPALKIASCPLVENGVIRILNLPGYSKFGPVGFDKVSRKLRDICADMDHEFWPDSVSLRTVGMIDWSRVLGHNQITDSYLLALVKANQGCLVTLDHRVTLSTVVGAAAQNIRLL